MGVMACDREACSNIMCNTCIAGKWYMCSDCVEEFKAYVETFSTKPATESEYIEMVGVFMSTRKGRYSGEEIELDEFLKKYTRL